MLRAALQSGYRFPTLNELFRPFRVGATHRVEARVEAFNAFNWFRWGNPTTNLNNANFGTPVDGSSPRMQMYMWARPNRPYRDGSLDGDVIAHEYGHGVSTLVLSLAILQSVFLSPYFTASASFNHRRLAFRSPA